jgi:hypothetical protein
VGGECLLRQAKPGAQRAYVLDFVGGDPAAGSQNFRGGEYGRGGVILRRLARDFHIARRIDSVPVYLGQVQFNAGMWYSKHWSHPCRLCAG